MGGLVLIPGAKACVGDRLLRRLEAVGAPVRCLARSPGALGGRTSPGTEDQLATLDPLELFRLLCWYGIYPLHALIFQRMLNSIAEAASSTTQLEAAHG